MDFFTGGGFLGNIVRGLGQRFGLGKRFDEPTYDMSRFSGLPLGGSAAFKNLDIRDKFDRRFQDTTDQIPVVIDNDMSLVPDKGLTVAPGDGILSIVTPQSEDPFFLDAVAKAKSDLAPEFQDMAIRASGTVGNYSQNEVANQLYGQDYRVLDPFTQQQIDKLIDDVGTKSTGELASGTSSDYI